MNRRAAHLVAFATHPVQYHAPVFREVQRLGLPVTVIYGSDFSIAGYRDGEFGTEFSWDVDLLSGYSSVFLGRVAHGGATSASSVRARGASTQLRRLNPSAVLLSGYGSAFDRGAIARTVSGGVPRLFRAETTDHAVQRTLWRGATRDTALRFFYARCDALLYVGQRSLAHFQRLGVADAKLHFAPYCVDTTAFATAADAARERAVVRQALNIPDESVVLLFSGKLVPRKGPDVLLSAVQTLDAATRARLAVVFLGDGEMRESLAAKFADFSVRFVGFKNQREISAYYNCADALVLPSRSAETWGLVVNEALHHGLPCIVSDAVGCAPDLVQSGETGEIFTRDDVGDLARAIHRTLSWIRATPGVADRCRKRVARYSTQQAAKGIIAAHERVCGGGAALAL